MAKRVTKVTKTKTGTSKLDNHKMSRKEYKITMARIEAQKAKTNKVADTIKEVGKSLASTGRTASTTYIAGKANDTIAAKNIAKEWNDNNQETALGRYWDVISGKGSNSNSGSNQKGSTTNSVQNSALD